MTADEIPGVDAVTASDGTWGPTHGTVDGARHDFPADITITGPGRVSETGFSTSFPCVVSSPSGGSEPPSRVHVDHKYRIEIVGDVAPSRSPTRDARTIDGLRYVFHQDVRITGPGLVSGNGRMTTFSCLWRGQPRTVHVSHEYRIETVDPDPEEMRLGLAAIRTAEDALSAALRAGDPARIKTARQDLVDIEGEGPTAFFEGRERVAVTDNARCSEHAVASDAQWAINGEPRPSLETAQAVEDAFEEALRGGGASRITATRQALVDVLGPRTAAQVEEIIRYEISRET